MNVSRGPLPPYVAYRTFVNYLAEVGARGVPAVIDRSVLPHKSGAIQSQLILTLQFLGLIDEDRRPVELLRRLVESQGPERRNLLRERLLDSYTFLASEQLDLATATSEQLEALFAQAGTSGETLRRALSFFLAMAREAGLKVSPYIRPHRGKRRGRRPAPAATAPPPTAITGDIQRTISLAGGGKLTLSFHGNVFLLDQKERDFLFELVDRLSRYESLNKE